MPASRGYLGGLAANRRLRSTTRSLLRTLDIYPPLSVDLLCERLAHHRRRPLHLRAYPFDVPGPSGMWIATAASDFIFYQSDTTPAHQDHIILHEVGHIVAQHDESGVADAFDSVAAGLFEHLAPEKARSVLRRQAAGCLEDEAELVAITIMEWASVLDHVAVSDRGDPRIDGVRDALDDGHGWL